MKKIKVSDELIDLKSSLNQKIYLSDIPEFKNGLSILYNTVFNKSATGIGGTSLALDSNENTIILMPFVEVVNNKDGYNADTFIVKEGVTVASITKYLKSIEVRKLVSTYDGLIKIKQAYNKAKLNIYNDFLLIDEWQVLFQQYGLRYNAIRLLLDESLKFTNKCFMTATPIKKEYWFEELLGLEELVIDYDLEPIVLKHYRAKNIVEEAAAVIKSKSSENIHFFINSVDTIKNILKYVNISNDDVRIICSKQDKNQAKLTGYKIESTKDAVKPINFYTSTCFEGCDIYDKNAKMYVLCDGSKSHSLVDISTTLSQIAGRIRDIEDTSVNLIYNASRYIDVTEEEFNIAVDENIKAGNIVMSEVKSKETIELIDLSKANDKYLVIEDGKLRFEVTLLNLDKHNFETSKTYSLKANLIAKASSKFTPVSVSKPWANELDIIESEKINKMTFKDKCIMYNETSRLEFRFSVEFDREVVDAVDKLGMAKLEELNFHKGDVRKALLGLTDLSDNLKVFKCLSYNTGEFIESSKLKINFNDIYTKLGIRKKAKGSDILDYYEAKESSARDKNGKVVKGYIIIKSKVIFK